MRPGRGVEEHSVRVEGRPKGLLERTEETLPAQVAIKQPRTLLAESLRFPEQGQSAQGQSDPKARPRGVADGQQVNIPAPPHWRYTDVGTQQAKQTVPLVEYGR